MFSKIHNSPKAQKYWPSAKRPAFMGAIAIAVVACSAPANAHCERHVYNTTDAVFHIRIAGQPSNNVVDHDIQPGENSSYWLISDGSPRPVFLHLPGSFSGRYPPSDRVWKATVAGSSCYINHDNSVPWYAPNFQVVWNEPADGDITIKGALCNPDHLGLGTC